MTIPAHVGLPHHDAFMFLMPALPALLIATIVLGRALESRGVLGAAGRMVSAYRPLALVAAVLSLAAAGVHFAVLEAHLEDDVGQGVFFFAVAWFQAIWAQLYMLRDDRRVGIAAVIVNSVVIVVWVISRTVGLPFGPTPGVPEVVGLPDLLATSFELALVGLVASRLMPQRFPSLASAKLPQEKAFVLVSFTIVATALLTAVALLPEAFAALEF